jgi:DNA-binding transcriptional ArsR family regulator
MMQQSINQREAAMLNALGHEHRLRILELLLKGERCVCEITPKFDLDPSVVCRHLLLLEQAGLIISRRDGRRVFYQIADQRVLRLLAIARQMIENPQAAKPLGPRARPELQQC